MKGALSLATQPGLLHTGLSFKKLMGLSELDNGYHNHYYPFIKLYCSVE